MITTKLKANSVLQFSDYRNTAQRRLFVALFEDKNQINQIHSIPKGTIFFLLRVITGTVVSS